MLRFYKKPGLSPGAQYVCLTKIASKSEEMQVKDLHTELCIYVQLQDGTQGKVGRQIMYVSITVV